MVTTDNVAVCMSAAQIDVIRCLNTSATSTLNAFTHTNEEGRKLQRQLIERTWLVGVPTSLSAC